MIELTRTGGIEQIADGRSEDSAVRSQRRSDDNMIPCLDDSTTSFVVPTGKGTDSNRVPFTVEEGDERSIEENDGDDDAQLPKTEQKGNRSSLNDRIHANGNENAPAANQDLENN